MASAAKKKTAWLNGCSFSSLPKVRSAPLRLNANRSNAALFYRETKLDANFHVVPKAVPCIKPQGFFNSRRNEFLTGNPDAFDLPEPTPHISPPSSPTCETPLAKLPRNAGTKRKCTPNRSPCYFVLSQSPNISPSPSPLKCRTEPRTMSECGAGTSSVPSRRRHKMCVTRSAKRELFQEITVAVSPNKQSRPNEVFDPAISPCRTPEKSSDKNACFDKFTGIASDSIPDKCLYSPKTGEPFRCSKKENRGSSWLGGITWQPKTPKKSPRLLEPPDSTKKRKYYVPGGLAQQLRKLELREQSLLNLQRHLSSSKGKAFSHLQVTEANISSAALPVVRCQDTSTQEEFLLVVRPEQIQNIVVGAVLKVTKDSLNTPCSSSSTLYCAPADMEVMDPGLVVNRSPHVVFSWQCPCRNGAHFDTRTCPSSVNACQTY